MLAQNLVNKLITRGMINCNLHVTSGKAGSGIARSSDTNANRSRVNSVVVSYVWSRGAQGWVTFAATKLPTTNTVLSHLVDRV